MKTRIVTALETYRRLLKNLPSGFPADRSDYRFHSSLCFSVDILSKVKTITRLIYQENVSVDEKRRANIDSSKIEVKIAWKAIDFVFSILCNNENESKNNFIILGIVEEHPLYIDT